VLSIIASVLAGEPDSQCTLIYGNRTTASIMFLEELQDLKDRYRERLHLLHVLSREPLEVELAQGRIDNAKLERILDTVIDPESVDEWFLCGPAGMVIAANATLRDRGIEARHIHRELFHADGLVPAVPPPAVRDVRTQGGSAVTVVLDGRRTSLTVSPDGRPILEAVLAVRPDAPYACKGGVCGTCRCRVIEGQVHLDNAYALEAEELAAGVVLACQAHPLTDKVVLDFDAA
jgi:ring-1,2-phenylacetyl-CoA epoxidase subunit PaaE